MNTSDKVPGENAASPGEIIPPSLAVHAMRDSGYKNTAYALAELIDNSIQADADLVQVFCVETRRLVNERERKRITEIAVMDNGSGMDPNTLQLALQFGNGTHLTDRHGIGRFGMGLPNASISQCRRVDVWTWTAGADNAITTHLDVDAIESGKMRNVPQPRLEPLPSKWRERATELSPSGTLVVWSQFEDHRLTWKQARATLDHTETISGRMYRKFLNSGSVEIELISVENGEVTIDRLAKPNDPLYLMANTSTPAPFDDKPMFQRWGDQDLTFPIRINDNEYPVYIRMAWAKKETLPEDGTDRGITPYGKHAAKNIGVSILRAGRELELDSSWANGYDPRERWWGVEVEFAPALDEVFGVTNNKQAANVFSHMAQFDWQSEAEPGETYMQYKQRLEDEEDPRRFLIDIVGYIRDQLSQVRTSLHDQTKGRRSGSRRHDALSVEDAASTQIKKRAAHGYKTPSDDEQFDHQAQTDLENDLVKNKRYQQDVAREIASAVKLRQRRIIFVTAEADSQAFFNVDVRSGGVTEVVFNSRHPAYDKLIKVLESDVSDDRDSDLIDRIENASATFKLLLAAWARYEEEDIPSREKIRDIRHEWGKMAKDFLTGV